MESTELKGRLLKRLQRATQSDIEVILDFSKFIISRRRRKKNHLPQSRFNPKNDPIFKLIGIADVEPFSKTIDRELYGK